MISSALYPLMRSAPRFQVVTSPFGSSMKIRVVGDALDDQTKALLGLAQLLVGGLRFLAGPPLASQELLTLTGDPSRLRDVARDRAHAEDPLAARVADHEVLVGDRDRLFGLPVPKVGLAGPVAVLDHRLDDHVGRERALLRRVVVRDLGLLHREVRGPGRPCDDRRD